MRVQQLNELLGLGYSNPRSSTKAIGGASKLNYSVGGCWLYSRFDSIKPTWVNGGGGGGQTRK